MSAIDRPVCQLLLLPFAPREHGARFELSAVGPRIAETRAVTVDVPDALQGVSLLAAGERMTTDDLAVAARVALATTDDGRLLIAEGSCTRDALQEALRLAGARDALELHTGPVGAQAHWGEGVLDAYPSTTLFALAREAPSPLTRLEPMMPPAPPPARRTP